MNDAEVLNATARRLFYESAERFRQANIYSLRSGYSLTADEQLNVLKKAVQQAKQALVMRAEALENEKQANRIWQMQATLTERKR